MMGKKLLARFDLDVSWPVIHSITEKQVELVFRKIGSKTVTLTTRITKFYCYSSQ